jgi:hypothetical protein
MTIRPPVSRETRRSIGGTTFEPTDAKAREPATFCTALPIGPFVAGATGGQ